MPALSELALRRIHEIAREDLAAFECGEEDLDTFLTDSAHDYSDHGLTETVVAYAPADAAPAGFFSLSADGLPLNLSETFELGLPFECSIKYFPAIKITKLAVRSDMQSTGLGSELIKAIEAIAFNSGISVRLLTVDAVNNPAAIRFYQRNGFKTTARQEIRQAMVSQRRPQRRGGAPEQPRSVLMYRDLYSPEEEAGPAQALPTAPPDQNLQT